ncbi:alpha/beta hydrolase [Chitinimonas sp. JJ19]|uniref:alpha/beta hydrolase n=1 Tax=Chitinimonas sp. JJ19 TaxID=3109352 RepID=UPI00300006C9
MPIKSMIALMLSLFANLASATGNHARVMPTPAATGPYPVACSNLALDTAAIAQAGVSLDQLWDGAIINGQMRYLTEVLAQPQAAINFNLAVPGDYSLYPRFANTALPMVSLVCYPTTANNPRPDYLLPDGRAIPHMDGAGELPLFPDNNRYPLIMYSHGMGGSPLNEHALGSITRFASHGYVVINPFHGDTRIKQVEIEDLSDLGDLIFNFDEYVELQALRPLAISAAITDLLNRPGYRDRIHPDQIGGFGGSLGGEALMLSLGAELTRNLNLDSRPVAQDARIKAVATFVPYAGQSFLPAFGRGQESASRITRPVMAIAGTADLVAPLSMSLKAVEKMRGSRYFVQLRDVPHQYLPEYANDIYGWTIPFFDAYLKGDATALSKLVQTASIANGKTDSLLLDATLPRSVAPGQILITEYVNSQTGNYLTAIDTAEIDLMTAYASQGWVATGQRFKAWQAAPQGLNSQAICRFYHAGPVVLGGGDSLYYSPDQALCEWGKTLPDWLYMGHPFYLALPGPDGSCPSGTLAISRSYNNAHLRGGDLNYRFSSSSSELARLSAQGWLEEATELCAPL